MTSQTIAIHILPNISRSKDNQIMKFGQLNLEPGNNANTFQYFAARFTEYWKILK